MVAQCRLRAALAALVFLISSGCASPAAPPANPAPPATVTVTATATVNAPPARPEVDLDSFAVGAKAAAESIRPDALGAHIRFLADDLLEGREPGTRGFELGARYVASELQALGLQPAGDKGTFFQEVQLLGRKLKSESVEISGGVGPVLKLVADEEFVGRKQHADVSGELVFVGYGLDVADYHYDDLADVDLRGKIVVTLGRAPRSERPDFFPPLASAVFGDGERKALELQRRGAIGVIGVITPEIARIFPFPRIVQQTRFESMLLPDERDRLPGVTLDAPAFDKLLAKARRPERLAQLVESASRQATHPFSLGLRAHLRVDVTERTVPTENVAAYVPSDPGSPVKDEMVLYGAHLDHMGIGDPVNGDRIYNGASDDAAGCASLLETARAFTVLSRARPPRRKILFLFVTGEERGLLGSKYFADHPTVPLRDVVADIDIDDAYPIAPIEDVVALGADESTLAVDAQRAAHALGLENGPDAHPEQNYFIRSDNWSFVKKGIPAAQILRGERGMSKEVKEATAAFWKGRYHQPQDEYEPKRDWRPFAEYTKFSFLLGLSIAQRADRPTWNANSFFRRFAEKERAR